VAPELAVPPPSSRCVATAAACIWGTHMTGLIDGYRRFNDRLSDAIVFVCKLIVASWVLALFVGAVTRYLTGVGYDWVQELPPILVPWVVFPLAGVLLRRDGHITVDFLPLVMGAGGRRVLRIIVAAIALGASIVFMIAGHEATLLFRSMGQLTQMELEFPLWYIYLSFPVGFALMANFAFEVLLFELLGRDRGLADAHKPEAM
jgi:TRAP-type C4-dicarboxylate transport system permease small subunit